MRRLTTLLPHLVVLSLISSSLSPAGNGKVSGRLYDVLTGSPIPGNVRVVGTLYGSSADSTGTYIILELPPGTYDIRCSAVGYTARVVAGFTIAADNLRKQDFGLQPDDINVEEIIVQADRLGVESSQTSARTDFDGSEFQALPLNTTMDLIALSPGTFKQFIGGALPVFSRTVIDGIDVTDETALWYPEQWSVSPTRVNGGRDPSSAQHSSFAEPPLDAVEQATLFTGTTGSEYSGAAGTLSYTLREGRGPWKGEASVRTSQSGGLRYLGPDIYWDADEYFAQRAILASSNNPTNRQIARSYTWTPGKYSNGRRPDVTASIASGGSLWDDAGLYLSGTWHASADRLPNQRTKSFTGSAKFTWGLSPTTQISLVGFLQDRGRLFGWKNSSYEGAYRFFLEGIPQWDGIHVTGGLKWLHLLSQSTSYDVQVSVVHDNVRRGFCDDNYDGIISLGENGDFLTFSDAAQVNRYQEAGGGGDESKFFSANRGLPNYYTNLLTSRLSWMIAHPALYYENSTSRVITLKGNVSSQLGEHHLLGFGSQARLHTFDRALRAGAGAIVKPGGNPFYEEVWTRNPADLDFYLQDRMEFSGLVMNLGLRLEGRYLDAAPIANWFDPADTVLDEQGGRKLSLSRGPLLPWKWFLAPHIGFSHPIGHTAAVHVSFSRSRLLLPYAYLFSGYSNWGPLTDQINVDHPTITAVKYGIGVQWAVAPGWLLGLNASYHDYGNMNLLRLTIAQSNPFGRYYAVTNGGSQDVRALEISLQQAITPLVFGISAGGRLAYAFSHTKYGSPTAKNKSTYSTAEGDSAAYGGTPPMQDVSTWDRSYLQVPGGSSSLIAGFNRAHRITCAFTFLFPWQIRLSGTGMFNSGFWYPETGKAVRIVPYAQAPWNRRVDLRLEKQISISGGIRLGLFVDVMNAFNWTNVLGYLSNIQAAQMAWEISGDPTGGPGFNVPVLPDNTLVYDIPREAYFGMRVEF